MTSSFNATTPGGTVMTWDSEQGFRGDVADMLNRDMQWAAGQTHEPPAVIARRVLLELLPGAVISDFVSVPLDELPPGVLS